MNAYKAERKKAIEYMAGNKSRVAITTDMWTADNQKKGYMAITGHFIDDSWKLRSVIMRYVLLFIFILILLPCFFTCSYDSCQYK